MPIYPNPSKIFINHPILGKGDIPERIGPMSTELAIWLESKTRYAIDIESGDALDKKMAISALNKFSDPKTHDWNMRCLLAATRGYLPLLCTPSGQLSTMGRVLGEMLVKIIQEHRPELRDIGFYRSEEWTQTDHVIVHGNISVRQAAMLKVIEMACLEADRNKREELDKEYLSARSAERQAEETKNQEMQEMVKDMDLSKAGEQERILEVMFERDSHNIPQSMQARLVGGYGPDRLAYVPTAMFGQRARNDLTNLVRYGLVDLKAVANGLRGRPKHIVRVSPPGSVIVADLVEQGII
jgi:hypothetical protein